MGEMVDASLLMMAYTGRNSMEESLASSINSLK